MRNDRVSVVRQPLYGKGANVAYTGVAGTTAAMDATGATAILVICTTLAYVQVGVNPTATVTDLPVAPNVPTLIPINDDSGAQIKVSAIQVAAGGTVYAIPVM